jgi:serine/threonine protein kinase
VSRAPTQKDPQALAPVPDFLCAGSSFARYEIVRCIGVGGMGAVFEATHALLRKRVALKAMHTALGRSEASRARFLREAETVARIRHPHVVDISDVGIERGVPFLVMEFLEGEDLSALLERERRLDVARAADIVLPVVAGLCSVHRLGIVHRDIKPENVFLALDALGDSVPKLLDFGVSKDLEASGHAGAPPRHTVAGTPYYMAPEQAHGSGALDARADQYAVGVLLYQCLAGVRPFQSESLLELIHLIDSGQYKPLAAQREGLPEPLVALIARAMARDPAQRFPDTESFGQALAAFASEPVRRACERDFAPERRGSLPLRTSHASAELRMPASGSAPLSAPTLRTEDPPLQPASAPTRAFPRRSVSGVQARDSVDVRASASAPSSARAPEGAPSSARAPEGAPGDPLRARRKAARRARAAFVVAALVTLLCLVGVLAALLVRRAAEPAALPLPARAEPARAPRALEPAAPGSDLAAPAPGPRPGASPQLSPGPRRSPGKPRREDANAPPPHSDIQLSR